MMAALKNDLEVTKAAQESQTALDDNSRAMRELLECIYGVGGVARDRIAKALGGRNGTTDTSGL